jgi:hypothetical protein
MILSRFSNLTSDFFKNFFRYRVDNILVNFIYQREKFRKCISRRWVHQKPNGTIRKYGTPKELSNEWACH